MSLVTNHKVTENPTASLIKENNHSSQQMMAQMPFRLLIHLLKLQENVNNATKQQQRQISIPQPDGHVHVELLHIESMFDLYSVVGCNTIFDGIAV